MKKQNLVTHLVLLDGISRSGKFFLGKLLSGFAPHLEYFQYIPILEHLPILEHFKKIERETAKQLLRLQVDEAAYNRSIGRNINTLKTDASYIGHSPCSKTSKLTASPITIPLFITHECFSFQALLFETWPALKIIELIRHPVDLVYSWYQKGWGTRFETDPLSFIPLLKNEAGIEMPWFNLNSSEDWENLKPIDKIIISILSLYKTIEDVSDGYGIFGNTLKRNPSIHWVRYEYLVKEPEMELIRINDFLNLLELDELKNAIKWAKNFLDRKAPTKRQDKLTSILDLDPKYSYKLLQLSERYESEDFLCLK